MSKLREKILNAKDQRKEKVYIEEWDVEIEVRSMTGKERAEIIRKSVDKDKDGQVDVTLLTVNSVIACCYDPTTGEKVFEPTDRDILLTKNAGALEKLAEVALELSGLGDKAKEKARKN